MSNVIKLKRPEPLATVGCLDVGEALDSSVKIIEALKTIVDKGTSIDTGGGLGSRDIWATIDGVEYYISVRAR